MDRPDATPVRDPTPVPATLGGVGHDGGSLLTATLSVTDEHSSVTQVLEVESALTQALPVPDLLLGGSVLLLVVMFHAFWIRVITNEFFKREEFVKSRAWTGYADTWFALLICMLLTLHLGEVLIWTATLVASGIVSDWAKAAYFAANSYTALGEPFPLPHSWRLVAPIMAISGIFTFAWTASILVDFVKRYNDVRAAQLEQHRHKHSS